MFSFAEFYAMKIICYTHCYPTRTVMVTIYVTGDMIDLASNHDQRNFIVELRSVQFLLLNEYVM